MIRKTSVECKVFAILRQGSGDQNYDKHTCCHEDHFEDTVYKKYTDKNHMLKRLKTNMPTQ
jgi:hypothetical protein